MTKIFVYYSGWGVDFHYATALEDGREIVVEFTDETRRRGVDLAPYSHPLASTPQIAGRNPKRQTPLPGFLNDSLPDGWGKLVVDMQLRKMGLNPAEATPLTRLAIVGDTAFGALRFQPAEELQPGTPHASIMEVAMAVREVTEGFSPELLAVLQKTGSAQGARPKSSMWIEPASYKMSTGPFPGGEPWLVKFPARAENQEVCYLEKLYADCATACGIEMPVCKVFPLPNIGSAAFGAVRFDRVRGMRVPTMTFAGLLDVDFRDATADYKDILVLTKRLTRDQREVEKLFLRCIFNVVFNNRDDHLKNFSMLLDERGSWRLTPAYDLTFEEGNVGYHALSVRGESVKVGRKHLLQLAHDVGIKPGPAEDMVARVVAIAGEWPSRLAGFSRFVRYETRERITAQISANVKQCR